MSVEQKWIINGLIAGLLLLFFPPFLYNFGSASDRQWHFFLDSRYTSSRESECERLADDGSTAFGSAIKHEYRKGQCMKENSVVRGYPGKVDLSFLLLEMVILGVGLSLGTVFRLRNLIAYRIQTERKKEIPACTGRVLMTALL
jgi:hypothetical protein